MNQTVGRFTSRRSGKTERQLPKVETPFNIFQVEFGYSKPKRTPQSGKINWTFHSLGVPFFGGLSKMVRSSLWFPCKNQQKGYQTKGKSCFPFLINHEIASRQRGDLLPLGRSPRHQGRNPRRPEEPPGRTMRFRFHGPGKEVPLFPELIQVKMVSHVLRPWQISQPQNPGKFQ